MESIKLSVQTDHKFLTWASIFCRCVANVKTLIGSSAVTQIFLDQKSQAACDFTGAIFTDHEDPVISAKSPVLQDLG